MSWWWFSVDCWLAEILFLLLALGISGFMRAAAPPSMVQTTQTHEMSIPNELIGCIIGRGGSKINEIRYRHNVIDLHLSPFSQLSFAWHCIGTDRLINLMFDPCERWKLCAKKCFCNLVCANIFVYYYI